MKLQNKKTVIWIALMCVMILVQCFLYSGKKYDIARIQDLVKYTNLANVNESVFKDTGEATVDTNNDKGTEKSDTGQDDKVKAQEIKSVETATVQAKAQKPTTLEPQMPAEGQCKCKPTKWPRPWLVDPMLNITHPWYNMTEEESIKRHHPNLPITLFRKAVATDDRCHLMPHIFTIDWINTYWQQAHMKPDAPFDIYSAFYDNRPNTEIRPCLRILAATETKQPKEPYCYFWFNATGPPVYSRVINFDFLDWQPRSYSRMLPFLLTCPIPKSVAHMVPMAVSLVKKPCQAATNVVRVVGASERDKKTAFVNGEGPTDEKGLKGWNTAICSTGLHYFHADLSIRIAEWLELVKAMGIAHVTFHVTDVHQNIIKVLDYYEQQGFVSVIDYRYPGPYMNDRGARRWWVNVQRAQMWSQENIYFTDCVLRNMHKYRFIAHNDPDEIPLIKDKKSYPELLDYILTSNKDDKPVASYKTQWNFHHEDLKAGPAAEDLSPILWLLRHNQRPKDHLKPTTGKFKSVYDTDIVTGVFSHHALYCNNGRCTQRVLSPNDVYLAHVRLNCEDKCNETGSVVEQNELLQYADEVKANLEKVIKKLQLTPPSPS